MHAYLKSRAAPVAHGGDMDIVGVIDDATDQVLEGFLEHLSCPPERPQPVLLRTER